MNKIETHASTSFIESRGRMGVVKIFWKGGSYNTLPVSNMDTVGKIVTILSKKMSLTDINAFLEIYEEIMGKGEK